MRRGRILLADGHPLVLGALDEFLGASPELEIVARACSGPEAMVQAEVHRPDLVVISLVLPEVNGLEVARRLAAVAWAPRIILTSFHDEAEYRHAAEAADNLAAFSPLKLQPDHSDAQTISGYGPGWVGVGTAGGAEKITHNVVLGSRGERRTLLMTHMNPLDFLRAAQ